MTNVTYHTRLLSIWFVTCYFWFSIPDVDSHAGCLLQREISICDALTDVVSFVCRFGRSLFVGRRIHVWSFVLPGFGSGPKPDLCNCVLDQLDVSVHLGLGEHWTQDLFVSYFVYRPLGQSSPLLYMLFTSLIVGPNVSKSLIIILLNSI